MGKIYNKKNKLYKITALCLTLVLLMTPLFSYADGKQIVMAENPGQTFAMEIIAQVAGNTVNTVRDDNGDVTGYNMTADLSLTDTWYVTGQNNIVLVPETPTQVGGNLEWKDENIEYTGLDIRYLVVSDLSTLEGNVVTADKLSGGKTRILKAGDIVGVYVKPTGIIASGEVTNDDIAKISYSCVASYRICKADSTLLPEITWKKADGTEVSSQYASGEIILSSSLTEPAVTSIKLVTGDNQTENYTVKYGCACSEDQEEKIMPDDITEWENSSNIVKAPALSATAENLKWTAYVAFVDDSGTNAVWIPDVIKSAQVYQTGDVASPSLSDVDVELQYYDSTCWQPVADYTDTEPYYGDAKKTYRFVVTIPDTADGSGVGIDKNKVMIMMDSAYPAIYDDVTGKYCTSNLAMPDTTVQVNLNVCDQAGNEANRTLNTVIGINSDLTVNKCMITLDPEGKIPADLTDGYYTNQKYYLSIEAISCDPFETIKATCKQGEQTEEFWRADDLDTLVRDEDTHLYIYKKVVALPLEDDSNLNDEKKGNIHFNSVHVYISNEGGQVYDTTETPLKSLGGFMYDNVEPEVGDVTLQSNVSGEWQDIDQSEISKTDGSVSIDVAESARYRYRFTISDVYGSGVDLSNVKCFTDKDCKTEYTNAVISKEGDTDKYICEISKEDVADAGNLALWIGVYDNAGNRAICALTPTLCEANMGFEFDDIYLQDASGRKIVWSKAWDIKTNKTYTLYVKVSSGYKIDEKSIGIRKNKTSENCIAGTIKPGTNIQDKVTKRYTAILMFELPNDPEINEAYENMLVYVASVAPDSKERMKGLGALIYDNSAPKVKLSETIPSKWVQSYSMKYEIVSGNQIEEALLNKASYTIDDREPVAIDVAGKQSVSGKIDLPESAGIHGTTVTFDAMDEAGNGISSKNKYTIYVDKSAPIIEMPVVGGTSQVKAPLTGAPVIKATVSDNLTLDRIWMKIQYPDGTVKRIEKTYGADGIREDISKSISYTLKADKNGNAQDGQYVATVYAMDKAGNEAEKKEIIFEVDNILPVVSASIISGTKGGKVPRKDGTDMYYRSDVGMHFTCKEYNLQSVTITDNGSPVDVSWDGHKCDAALSGEGRHVVTISAVDTAGNRSIDKKVEFVIDKSAPVLSLALNGLAYTEERGIVDLSGDAAVSVSVSDLTEDINDFYYNVVQTKPDQATTNSAYLKSAARNFTFAEEADYTVNCYAVDMANNPSVTRSVSFRIDKTAPELSISGIPAGGASADPVTINCLVKEAFWKDASGRITIYRKAGDGVGESVYKTIDVKMTAHDTSISESLTETGEYRIEFEASDRVGHTATASQNVIIDCDAPEITLSGVNNYDVTDKTVKLHSEISDAFYSSKKVTVEGTRTDIDGKVNKLSFSSYDQHGNPTVIEENFDQDGIYDITITSSDAAGNNHSSHVHFTVDKTAPVIGSLDKYDGTVLTIFDGKIDLDDIVSDLTVCDMHMYLNGSEYDGTSEVEDGSYTLLITAEDELGHYSERMVSFVLDTKPPVFIVTGVEDGDSKKETYSIDISLQLEEDTLQQVTLNGSEVTIQDNMVHLDVTNAGKYSLYMKAADTAGNEAEQTIEFRYGMSSNIILWIIIGCAVLAIGIVIILFAKKKVKNR